MENKYSVEKLQEKIQGLHELIKTLKKRIDKLEEAQNQPKPTFAKTSRRSFAEWTPEEKEKWKQAKIDNGSWNEFKRRSPAQQTSASTVPWVSQEILDAMEDS